MPEAGVEVRLGKIRGGLAQNLSGLGKLAVLAFQRLDPLAFVCRGASSTTLVPLGLDHPVVKGLRRTPDLRRNRDDRCPLRGVIAPVSDHHPHRARTSGENFCLSGLSL